METKKLIINILLVVGFIIINFSGWTLVAPMLTKASDTANVVGVIGIVLIILIDAVMINYAIKKIKK